VKAGKMQLLHHSLNGVIIDSFFTPNEVFLTQILFLVVGCFPDQNMLSLD